MTKATRKDELALREVRDIVAILKGRTLPGHKPSDWQFIETIVQLGKIYRVSRYRINRLIELGWLETRYLGGCGPQVKIKQEII